MSLREFFTQHEKANMSLGIVWPFQRYSTSPPYSGRLSALRNPNH